MLQTTGFTPPCPDMLGGFGSKGTPYDFSIILFPLLGFGLIFVVLLAAGWTPLLLLLMNSFLGWGGMVSFSGLLKEDGEAGMTLVSTLAGRTGASSRGDLVGGTLTDRVAGVWSNGDDKPAIQGIYRY